jgi:hypothetical protein
LSGGPGHCTALGRTLKLLFQFFHKIVTFQIIVKRLTRKPQCSTHMVLPGPNILEANPGQLNDCPGVGCPQGKFSMKLCNMY